MPYKKNVDWEFSVHKMRYLDIKIWDNKKCDASLKLLSTSLYGFDLKSLFIYSSKVVVSMEWIATSVSVTLDMLVGTVTPITMTVVLLLAPMVSIWSLKRDCLSNLYLFSHTKKFFFPNDLPNDLLNNQK